LANIEYKFLSFGLIEDNKKINVYYEILLEYEELDVYYRWLQKLSPVETNSNMRSADLYYKPIYIPYEEHNAF
jgi:hypothetical protein